MTAPLPHGIPVSGQTARRLAADVSARRITVSEATIAALERIALSEPRVRALIHVDGTGALAASRRTGRDLLLGRQPGRLVGVPVVVKDNIAVRDLPLTCGSASRKSSVAGADATLVRRLRAAGAVVVAKSNLDEFGMGATTESSAFGPSRNPHDLTRTPGGSSGGSAASVAAGQVPLAVGTDTGGSIREPASQCGLVGVKPSYGSIPRDGIVPFAPSLDQAGPLASDVLDAALLHDAMAATTGLACAALRGQRDPRLAGMRIGVVTQMSGPANAPGVRLRFDRMVSTLCSLGAEVVEVSVPAAGEALDTYYLISSYESVSVLQQHAASGELGPEALRRLAVGEYLDSRPQSRRSALRGVHRIRAQAAAAFADCDLLVAPTMPVTAPRLGLGSDDPLAPPRTDCWTVLANLTEIPSLSLPAGTCPDTDLPVGVQLMAQHGDDALMYQVAAAAEIASS